MIHLQWNSTYYQIGFLLVVDTFSFHLRQFDKLDFIQAQCVRVSNSKWYGDINALWSARNEVMFGPICTVFHRYVTIWRSTIFCSMDGWSQNVFNNLYFHYCAHIRFWYRSLIIIITANQSRQVFRDSRVHVVQEALNACETRNRKEIRSIRSSNPNHIRQAKAWSGNVVFIYICFFVL